MVTLAQRNERFTLGAGLVCARIHIAASFETQALRHPLETRSPTPFTPQTYLAPWRQLAGARPVLLYQAEASAPLVREGDSAVATGPEFRNGTLGARCHRAAEKVLQAKEAGIGSLNALDERSPTRVAPQTQTATSFELSRLWDGSERFY